MDDDLDALVKRADEDRWLSSRLAPRAARVRLIALYAANYEIARTADAVREPALGDIRLQFWRNVVAAVFEGRAPPAHPAAAALAACVREAGLPREPLDTLIDARGADLANAPFESWTEVDAYVDATSGGLVRLAAAACAPGVTFSRGAMAAFAAAGRAWGFCGLARAAPVWALRRRTYFPRRLLQHVGVPEEAAAAGRPGAGLLAAMGAMLDRAEAALKEAQRLAVEAPSACFPAIAHVALTRRYVAAVRRGEAASGSALMRRMTVVSAAARGGL